MTTSTRTRRPEIVVADVVPDRPRASVRRQQGQYIALNGVAMVIIAAVALALIGILYLMQTARVAGLGYKFSDLQSQYYSLSLENSKLGYQVARDQSLDKVNQIATEQLGMTPLKNFQFLQVQRPANDNLPPTPPDVQPQRSLLQRIKAAITGQSSASVHEASNSDAGNGTVNPTNNANASAQDGANATPVTNDSATPESTVGTAP
jgi:cell division protein FtsL